MKLTLQYSLLNPFGATLGLREACRAVFFGRQSAAPKGLSSAKKDIKSRQYHCKNLLFHRVQPEFNTRNYGDWSAVNWDSDRDN